jgi:hypothetical protein
VDDLTLRLYLAVRDAWDLSAESRDALAEKTAER